MGRKGKGEGKGRGGEMVASWLLGGWTPLFAASTNEPNYSIGIPHCNVREISELEEFTVHPDFL